MEPDLLLSLYKKYHNQAFVYTFSLCKSKEMAEDIVSDAFEKAFMTLDESRGHFKYWLLVVCRNLWIDYVRRNKEVYGVITDDQIIEKERVLEKVIKNEESKQLYRCIIQLPHNYQEILVLHYYGGVSLVDIAKMLKISNSNAKTLIFRARTKLKKSLEEDGYEF